MPQATELKRFNAFEKGLKKKSTIYLNSEISNLLKDYPDWEFDSAALNNDSVATFYVQLNDWSPGESLGDTTISYSNGLEITVGFPSQKQIYRLIPNWSRRFNQDVPGDSCFYCGAFNGPHGELRLNHDCCHCMCN